MIVKFTCGHECNVTVLDREQARKIKQNPGICPECIANAYTPKALTLPKLQGTQKQIAWAEQIRTKVVQHKDDIKPFVEAEAKQKPYMVNYIMNALDRFIESETSASNWIETFKPITSQYSTKPPHTHIIGGMAQKGELFGLYINDVNFLYDVGRYQLQ